MDNLPFQVYKYFVCRMNKFSQLNFDEQYKLFNDLVNADYCLNESLDCSDRLRSLGLTALADSFEKESLEALSHIKNFMEVLLINRHLQAGHQKLDPWTPLDLNMLAGVWFEDMRTLD